jgi:hypothetical protein
MPAIRFYPFEWPKKSGAAFNAQATPPDENDGHKRSTRPMWPYGNRFLLPEA